MVIIYNSSMIKLQLVHWIVNEMSITIRRKSTSTLITKVMSCITVPNRSISIERDM